MSIGLNQFAHLTARYGNQSSVFLRQSVRCQGRIGRKNREMSRLPEAAENSRCLRADEASAKDFGPGSVIYMPGDWLHVSGCRPGRDCVFFQEADGKFDFKPASTAQGH